MPSPITDFRCWAEISASALLHNVAVARSRKHARLIAVVKADAYGHGLAQVLPVLASRVDFFGVACLDEALAVRAQLPTARVLLLGPALPHERAAIVAHGFTPLLSSTDEAAAYAAVVPAGENYEVHLKVDTAMGRIGAWQQDALTVAKQIAAIPALRLAAVATHLPVSDEDADFTHLQLAAWRALADELARVVGHPLDTHASNSAGILGFDDGQTLARPGLMLYGASPLPEMQPRLLPVLTWKTRITLLRELGPGRTISYGRTFTTQQPTRVATLAVGYADGYRRSLTGKNTHVLIAGRRCPILGRVTMDQILADVTGLDNVQTGDEAVLLGKQGSETIAAAELAEKAGTIPWEIFTGIGSRVRRVAVD